MGDIGLSVETSYTARQIWANHVIQGLQTAATMPKAEPAASDTASTCLSSMRRQTSSGLAARSGK